MTMLIRKGHKKYTVIFCLIAIASVFVFSTRHETIDFSTQVKPILNQKCISCHGGVKKQAGFSLLFRSEALAKTESGKPLLYQGNPAKAK
jgi:hypothetical protein